MPSLVVIGPQVKEKQREGAMSAPPPPALMVLKDPSLNRVKAFNFYTTCWILSVEAYIISLSKVYAYVHLTNTGFFMFILCCDVYPFKFISV